MTVYIIDLENIPTRYTCEWKTHLPLLVKHYGGKVHVIYGPDDMPDCTTPGMFLNFSATNIYKSSQVEKFSHLFSKGKIKDGDYFLFADAWHPGVINLRYMADLLGIKIKIGGLWHAGSYDPHDGLGRIIGNAPWVRHAEKSYFYSFDHNYFATDFHIDLFVKNLLNDGQMVDQQLIDKQTQDFIKSNKIVRSGWPMEYMPAMFNSYDKTSKSDIIIFPHRIAPEKQVDIFCDLAKSMPEYEFIVCQDSKLTKEEYHRLLAKSKIMWSANLQETLGISPYEGALLDVVPLLPDRLSYPEMYSQDYLYPSEWTQSFDNYLEHKDKVVQRIKYAMDNYETLAADVRQNLVRSLTKEYFSASKLLNLVLK